jgi:glucose/arabinose dehydrogenase
VKGLLAAAAALVAALVAGCAGGSGDGEPERPAAPEAQALSLQTVARGLDAPVHVTAPRNERGRLYVVEQAGRIVVVENGRVRSEPFLDIRSLVRSGGEQGLLSVAFHPRYARNRLLYVNYTDLNGHTRVVEYRSNGTRALPGSARQILLVRQPYPNHNGGQNVFGPDGRLYVGMGDGGAGGDPLNRAQNPRELLGKLIRIDVGRPAGPAARKIVAYGLRNPWRVSFDRRRGDLWIGDVGEGSWEEIDYLPRRRLGRVVNFGWDIYEGRAAYEPKPRGPGALVHPVAVYANNGSECSVTGGFVYRGSAVPAARGRYFYGDFCSGIVRSLRIVNGRVRTLRRERFRVEGLTSFGEDARGELYLASHGGTIYRLAR